MFSYTGKAALITGASSGIGEAFAQILAARSMNLCGFNISFAGF
jgi:short-subunit dehydrogenase